MAHSAGHGNSAFGLGQFNGPVKGPRNSAFGRGRSTSGTYRNWTGGNWSGRNWSGSNWTGGNWSGGNWGGDWRRHGFSNDQSIFIGGFGFPFYSYPYYGYYPYDYYGYGSYPYGNYSPYGYDSDYYSGSAYGYGYYGDQGYGYSDQGYGYGDRYGDRSSIAQLQRQLARAGYYHGAIDGTMGPETRSAIRAFERSYGALGMR